MAISYSLRSGTDLILGCIDTVKRRKHEIEAELGYSQGAIRHTLEAIPISTVLRLKIGSHIGVQRSVRSFQKL